MICHRCGEDHLIDDYCMPHNRLPGGVSFRINLLILPELYRRFKKYLQERKRGKSNS